MLYLTFMFLVAVGLIFGNWLLTRMRVNNKRPPKNYIEIIGKCDAQSLRSAYALGTVAPIGCPDFTNPLRVNEQYRLMESPAMTSSSDNASGNDCCYVDPDPAHAVPKAAEICVSTLGPSTYPLRELNQNPYSSTGGLSLSFVRPGEDFAVSSTGKGARVYMGKHAKFVPTAVPMNESCVIDSSWQPRTEFERIIASVTWVPLPASLQ